MKIEKSKTKKIFDILIFVGVFVFFLLALTCAILKFSGTTFKIFKTSYDVVLTDSMSVKNEKYADFLEGHDDQYQPMDVVKAKKVTSADQLHVYDVVIYNDPIIGRNMHRIVGIKEDGCDGIVYKKASKTSIGSYSGVSMVEIDSAIETDQLSFDEAEFTVFTTNLNDQNRYNFNALSTDINPQIFIEEVPEGAILTYKVKRDTTAPGAFHIAHKYSHIDYSKDLIISLKINSSYGFINSVSDDLSVSESNLVGKYNERFLYEIRGDKFKVSDGYFPLKDIEAKAVKRIPKLGYFFRFMESLHGAIMFILLGFLFLATSIIRDVMLKKEALETESGKKYTYKQYFAYRKEQKNKKILDRKSAKNKEKKK